MRYIELTRGLVAMVDDEDYEYLNQWKWHAVENRKTFYATRVELDGTKRISIKMHRLIMQTPRDLEVDHIDRTD